MDEKWLEVTITVPAGGLDQVCETLTAAGMTGLAIEDGEQFKAFLEQNRQYWGCVDEELSRRMKGASRVKFYVTDNETGRAQLQKCVSLFDLPYTVLSLAQSDWAHGWQQYYKPMAAGSRLYIVPEWERGAAVPDGRTPVLMNPGLTFGTGSHASTRLCLEGLERHLKPGDKVLDLGCGSGILSIAALLLGASSAAAVDIDPMAVGVAYENAALNGIGGDRCTVLSGDILSDVFLLDRLRRKKYNLVLANIVADVIIPLSREVPGLLETGGVFLCSGILDSRAGEVAAVLEKNGLAVAEQTGSDGWAALAARSRG
jgi:ribosomal protein L11 methyltransferase